MRLKTGTDKRVSACCYKPIDKADPDITAMAIQALARYRSMNVTVNGTEKNVGDAIERGLDALSAMQKSAGDFDSWGTTNVESTAQVLMALIAMCMSF